MIFNFGRVHDSQNKVELDPNRMTDTYDAVCPAEGFAVSKIEIARHTRGELTQMNAFPNSRICQVKVQQDGKIFLVEKVSEHDILPVHQFQI